MTNRTKITYLHINKHNTRFKSFVNTT